MDWMKRRGSTAYFQREDARGNGEAARARHDGQVSVALQVAGRTDTRTRSS